MINRTQYNNAIKIVNEYEKQKLERSKVRSNEFGFMYWIDGDAPHISGSERHKCITAKNIESACKKFLRLAPKTLWLVDYEVSNNSGYIDISERKEFKDFL